MQPKAAGAVCAPQLAAKLLRATAINQAVLDEQMSFAPMWDGAVEILRMARPVCLVRFIQSLEHKDLTQPVSSIKVLVASLGLEPMDFA